MTIKALKRELNKRKKQHEHNQKCHKYAIFTNDLMNMRKGNK